MTAVPLDQAHASQQSTPPIMLRYLRPLTEPFSNRYRQYLPLATSTPRASVSAASGSTSLYPTRGRPHPPRRRSARRAFDVDLHPGTSDCCFCCWYAHMRCTRRCARCSSQHPRGRPRRLGGRRRSCFSSSCPPSRSRQHRIKRRLYRQRHPSTDSSQALSRALHLVKCFRSGRTTRSATPASSPGWSTTLGPRLPLYRPFRRSQLRRGVGVGQRQRSSPDPRAQRLPTLVPRSTSTRRTGMRIITSCSTRCVRCTPRLVGRWVRCMLWRLPIRCRGGKGGLGRFRTGSMRQRRGVGGGASRRAGV